MVNKSVQINLVFLRSGQQVCVQVPHGVQLPVEGWMHVACGCRPEPVEPRSREDGEAAA